MDRAQLASLVHQIEVAQAENRPMLPYRLVRKFVVFPSLNPTLVSEVIAEIDFSPPNLKKYVITKASGNSRAEQAVRGILDHEVEAAAQGRYLPTAALIRGNYEVTRIGDDVLEGHPCLMVGLTPTRKDKYLISGRAWIDRSSFLVRQVSGDFAKSPSWWVKNVHTLLKFDDVHGTWMPTSTEAVADVRVFGSQTLRSEIIDYRVAAGSPQ